MHLSVVFVRQNEDRRKGTGLGGHASQFSRDILLDRRIENAMDTVRVLRGVGCQHVEGATAFLPNVLLTAKERQTCTCTLPENRSDKQFQRCKVGTCVRRVLTIPNSHFLFRSYYPEGDVVRPYRREDGVVVALRLEPVASLVNGGDHAT